MARSIWSGEDPVANAGRKIRQQQAQEQARRQDRCQTRAAQAAGRGRRSI